MARTAASMTAGRPGFSLPELVMVLAVIAVLGALAAPRYANALNRYRADAAAARIVADLHLARSLAVAASRSVTLRFAAPDLPPDAYEIPDHAPDSPAGSHYVVHLAADPYRARIAAVDLPDARAVFDGFGTPADGGSVTIRAGGVTRTVTLDADTGHARVQ